MAKYSGAFTGHLDEPRAPETEPAQIDSARPAAVRAGVLRELLAPFAKAFDKSVHRVVQARRDQVQSPARDFVERVIHGRFLHLVQHREHEQTRRENPLVQRVTRAGRARPLRQPPRWHHLIHTVQRLRS